MNSKNFQKNSYHKVHIEKNGSKKTFYGKYIGSNTLKDKTIHKFDETDKDGTSVGREQWVQNEYIHKTIPHKMNLKYGTLTKEENVSMIGGSPTNNVGSGDIAGLGVGPQGEPGVNLKKRKKVMPFAIFARKPPVK